MVHSTFAVRGGAERYLEDVAAGLTARGHQVRIFSRDTVPGRPRITARIGDRMPAPIRKALVHLGDLVDPSGLGPRALRDFAPDVVHAHNWQELGVLPLARIAAAYPTVHTVHDHAILDPNNALGNLGRSRTLDVLLRARSAWIRRRFRRMTLLFAAARTRDAVGAGPNGQVLPLAVAGPRRDWPAGRRDVFLFLGALSTHKGLDLLLDAWDPAMGTLLVAGDGPMRADVERAAAAEKSVRFLGYLDEAGKQAALRQAGWLVFPSRRAETFGLSCAEALIAGRPVIAAERVRPPTAADSSLLLYGDPAELPKLLARAAGMPAEEYASMAASAAADGRGFDWDQHLDALLDIYAAAGAAP
ncbi:glycosyltransferase [Actinoplanes sp. NPDC049668]|uniref:glycosyltransferase n=1 Tax=unclassified Actinoplanes TaxID=2626549 RepID=UPI0033B9F23B